MNRLKLLVFKLFSNDGYLFKFRQKSDRHINIVYCSANSGQGESQGWGSLVGCRLWGRTESDTTEVTQQQQEDWSELSNPALPESEACT